MEAKKVKLLTLGDHPMSPSGVGTQTKYICEALLDSGKFSIVSLGGAIKHHNYNPITIEPYGEEWRVIPIDGYGTQEMIRSVIRTEEIDMVWLMTDPRFWGWFWEIENEIRSLVPVVYYHVWDNYPYPFFNRDNYLSNDHIVTISKVTDDIVKTVAPEVSSTYLPHSVNTDVFKPMPPDIVEQLRKEHLHEDDQDKALFFWNNRNARRKQSGTLVYWFKEFIDKVGHDKAQLIMHTDAKDPHGQDLEHILEHLGLNERQVLISGAKIMPEDLACLYNMADVTINISDAEGFGLSTMESLACGTPIVVNMTGGLQEQVTNGEEWFGEAVFPTSKAIIGSQDVPYIYEDRTNKAQFISALSKMMALTRAERKLLGAKGRQHVLKNYNFKDYKQKWVDLMLAVFEKHGSWETRSNYSGVYFAEVA